MIKLLSIVMLSVSCSANESPGQFPKPQAQSKSAVEREAQKVAEEFLTKTFRKCGDSYFYSRHPLPFAGQPPPDPRRLLWQIKGFSWRIAGEEILPPAQTEADRLNGVPPGIPGWEGSLSITGTASRAYGYPGNFTQDRLTATGKWFPWVDGGAAVEDKIIKLGKREGKWSVDFPHDSIDQIDCNAIPGVTAPDIPPLSSSSGLLPAIKAAPPVEATLVSDPMLLPSGAGGPATLAGLSSDEKHRLYHAAIKAADGTSVGRVLNKMAFSSPEALRQFRLSHNQWLKNNQSFADSISTPEKARAYLRDHEK